MKDALVVYGGKPLRQAIAQEADLGRRQAAVLQRARQRRSIDIFHHQIAPAPLVEKEPLVFDDGLALDLAQSLRFLTEQLDDPWLVGKLGADDLDRMERVENDVPAAIDGAHAARRQECFDAIGMAEDLADADRRSIRRTLPAVVVRRGGGCGAGRRRRREDARTVGVGGDPFDRRRLPIARAIVTHCWRLDPIPQPRRPSRCPGRRDRAPPG